MEINEMADWKDTTTSSTTPVENQTRKEVKVAEKYVLLEITTEQTGFTLQKIYGHPNVGSTFKKMTEWQPAVVVPTYRAKLTLFDENSKHFELNVTRDAWYYLGNSKGEDHCRNIAFEPKDAAKNQYLTEEIHFPSAADSLVRGFFLLQKDSPRGERWLQAEPVSQDNLYGQKIPFRDDPAFAHDVMFHIGGFYEASARFLHFKWLGGSEGCFAFIPKKSMRDSADDASKITWDTSFISNKIWIEWTTIISRHRDLDPNHRFIVKIDKRNSVEREAVKTIIRIEKPDVTETDYVPI